MRLNLLPLTIAALVTTGIVQADDRDATPAEHARVMDAMKAQGCSSAEEIEVRTDGSFEVDDAVCEEGKKYDLILDRDLKIISRHEDRD